ncbi:MAG: hypothetical protein GEU80_15070 [Dehalococcoidia bacterium]|nr:hypothetical protein [Dehalococcoidia bacterium]
MLFLREHAQPIADGRITLTFRRWTRPQAKPGGRYRVWDAGLIEVTSVETVAASRITDDEARRAGFADRETLLGYLGADGEGAGGEAEVYRVEFRFAGPDDRPGPPAHAAELSDADIETLRGRLERMDARSGDGPWTLDTLRAIEAHPRRRAADLAAQLGRERLPFKADVRKLKALGLTLSREVGYELAPRGKALLEKL